MKSLYRRLAVTNLKNNKQFYLPYLLVGILSVTMFYSMWAMQGNKGLRSMSGGMQICAVLSLGLVIVGICVCIFLFYTNSFVMKRRKKELGVYNILGMEKRHIAKVLVWESVILFVLSVGGGLVFGILFNKLLTMFLYTLTGFSESIPFYISRYGCEATIVFFAIVNVVILLYNFIQVKMTNPIDLLHSSNTGEREPKSKWVLGILGLICMIGGYYLSITIESAIEAISIFFIAVVLVIIGTYALFSVISIIVLKGLKKNKKYYYKTKHFTSVSGMIYRMKQNATGLANICILSTMVLVMVSTTVCLYAGLDDTVNTAQEKELDVAVNMKEIPEQAEKEMLSGKIKDVIEKQKRTITSPADYLDCYWFTRREEAQIVPMDKDTLSDYSYTDLTVMNVVTAEDYEAYSGQKVDPVEKGKVMVASLPEWESDTIDIFGEKYPVQEMPEFPDKGESNMITGDGGYMYVIVPDYQTIQAIEEKEQKLVKTSSEKIFYHTMAEIDGSSEQKKECAEAIRKEVKGWDEYNGVSCVSKTEYRESEIQMNGGFFFLGLFLGVLFLMITVLIIYYKQISEGYEDRERFRIMTKVGMSRKEVKSSINSQVCTVFFLPIIVAVIHLAGAFPMLRLMLAVFGLTNTQLFVVCLVATAVVFAAIYFLVYKLTSKCYYKIVYK